MEQLLKVNSSLKNISKTKIEDLKLRAIAHIENLVIKKRDYEAKEDNYIYFDIETELFSNYEVKRIWAIGVSDGKEFQVFFSSRYEDEVKILNKFLNYLKHKNNSSLVSYSGTQFDKKILDFAFNRHKLDFTVFSNKNHIDLCKDIKDNYILPIKSYGLKSAASYFGYKFENPYTDALLVNSYYNSLTKNNPENKDIKNELFYKYIHSYIKDDVMSLSFLHNRFLKNEIDNLRDVTDFYIDYNSSKIKKIENKVISSKVAIDECPACGGNKFIKFGFDRNNRQRFLCKECRKSF